MIRLFRPIRPGRSIRPDFPRRHFPRILLIGIHLGAASCGGTDLGDAGPPEGGLIDPVDGTCESGPVGRTDLYADCVEAFEPAPGVSFGHDAMPSIVLGPPQGGGETTGGTHVASLGCGGSITLHFSEPWPTDGPGPDLVIFENAFVAGGITFIEPAQVLVSEDGEAWFAFECEPETDEADGCAGLGPVQAETTDPTRAGGDPFDLADVGLSEARYVRIVDRTAEHYGEQTWCQGSAGGFDLDAVGVWEAER